MAVDPVFGLNHYNKPKSLSESETVAYNILTLLLGKPGFYPSIPQLGMNISQYLYSFEDNFDTTLIKAILAAQCSDFVPQITDGSFDVIKARYKEQPMIVFKIPTILANEKNELVLGITMDGHGALQFNFVFNKQQYI